MACGSTAQCAAVDTAGNAFVGSPGAGGSVPGAISPPSISGTATQGETLTETHGSWSNGPTGFAHQWQRCDGSGNNCVAISGATAQSYALTAADVGSTIRVREVASNGAGPSAPALSAQTAVVAAPGGTGGPGGGGGGTPGGGTPGPGPGAGPPAAVKPSVKPDTIAPLATAYGVVNKVFAVGAASTPTTGSATRAKARPKGTTFRYRLSEAATVKIVISQQLPGRRSGRRCVAPTKKLAKARRCNRLLVKGTLTRTSRLGANRVAFSGVSAGRR